MGDSRRSRRHRKQRLRLAALVSAFVIAVGAIVALGFARDASLKAPDTGAAASYKFAPPQPPDTSVRVAVIGDSVSKGTPENTAIWPDLVGKARGWKVINAAGGGGGYVNGLNKNRAFRNQITAAVARNPHVVIVAGSRNDRTADPAEVGAQATEVLRQIRARLPQTRIVVVGPIWDNNRPTPEVLAVNEAVRGAATESGAQFVDALGGNWLATPDLVQGDSTHPTDAGQKVIADRMLSVLPQITLPPSSDG